MTPLWTASDAAEAIGAKPVPGANWTTDGVSIDTRAVAPGDLFVALKGPRFDGHDFVAAALAGGAAAAMVDRAVPGVDATRLLTVADTPAGLEALARAARARTGASIVAVTGSVGKTSTKEALAKVLSAQGPTHASIGNLNNQIGMPLSLARMPAGGRFGVFELGMNHANEIAPLSRMLRPAVAIITNVEAVHLEYFDSVAGIADAKAEIFQGMDRDGTAILNRDNPHFERLAAAASARGIGNVWSFGTAAEADGRLKKLSLRPDGSQVEALIRGQPIAFSLPTPGLHHVLNALAVLLAVAAVGADVDAAAAALAGFQAVEGRGAARTIQIDGGSFRLIDESYNASPAALQAALAVLGMSQPGPGGSRIVALGDMLELGPAEAAAHAGLAEAVIRAGVHRVFAAGPLMRYLYTTVPAEIRGAHEADSAALAPIVAGAVRAGDVVLVKGSAGSRMGVVVKALLDLDQRAGEAPHAV